MSAALVGIIVSSEADLPAVSDAAHALGDFGVPFEVRIISPHLAAEAMFAYAREAQGRGLQLLIAGDSGAAHLAGMVASVTLLPVIGVPIALRQFDGLDSLLSTVQMPRGIPVACVAIGNFTNAALLAVRILSLGDERLRRALAAQRDATAVSVKATDVAVKARFAKPDP